MRERGTILRPDRVNRLPRGQASPDHAGRRAARVCRPLTMVRRLLLLAAVALVLAIALESPTCAPAAAAEGQMTFAVTVSLAPTWFIPRKRPASSRRS